MTESLEYYEKARNKGDEKLMATMRHARQVILISESTAAELQDKSPIAIYVTMLSGPRAGEVFAVRNEDVKEPPLPAIPQED